MFRYIKNYLKRYEVFREIAKIRLCSSEGIYPVYRCRDFTYNTRIRNFLRWLVTPIGIARYFFPCMKKTDRKGLAFVLTARNEARYIEEWIDFHVKQGVSHFFIYDNESTDNLHDVLRKYIDSGLVTYSTVKGNCRQTDIYNMAVSDYGRKYKYMAFIDADEFVFVRNNDVGGG
ncbi:MAG: glycosyltransferase family 2 protein [Synergistaceae bacterium]|nr:glycosyltransferase family 2 protein [Synergistaceae bacterium]